LCTAGPHVATPLLQTHSFFHSYIRSQSSSGSRAAFPSQPRNPPPVTYARALSRQDVLLLRLYCSTLTNPVQALLSGHALTITPSIKCAPVIINLPASTPLIALWRSGKNSGVATSLGTLLLAPRCLILKNQCHYCLMLVRP
jgi:hypothetical protein